MYAFLAFATYLWFLDELSGAAGVPPTLVAIPRWQLGLANAGIVFVVYGLLGLAGYWFASRLGLPGVFREDSGWRGWVFEPMLWGLGLGIAVVVADWLFALVGRVDGFAHPAFPLSVIASATAAIGEEIMFRCFAMGLWAFLLNLILRRWGKTGLALWLGNGIAALAFGAGHLGSTMLLLDASSPAEIPARVLVEVLLINGIIGIIAGDRYRRNGLVAAVGVHFWTDIVWHVIWPFFPGAGTR
jgi:hypothetical protein